MYRSIAGDRLYHLHDREIEDVRLTTLSDVIERTVNATDLPLSVFQAPGVAVCGANCRIEGDSDVTLSDTYGVAWEVIAISISFLPIVPCFDLFLLVFTALFPLFLVLSIKEYDVCVFLRTILKSAVFVPIFRKN